MQGVLWERLAPSVTRFNAILFGSSEYFMEGSTLRGLTMGNDCPPSSAVVGTDSHQCQMDEFRQEKSGRQAGGELYMVGLAYYPSSQLLTG